MFAEQVAGDALRSLEESRANLAAIQVAAQRSPSLKGPYRAPRPRSGRRGPRYTLDEAALILQSLPAVPEGDAAAPAAAAGGDDLVKRAAGLERFLSDVQRQPPAVAGGTDDDYRRMARSLQDQAAARMSRHSSKSVAGGAYTSMGPASQDSTVRDFHRRVFRSLQRTFMILVASSWLFDCL